MPNTHLSNTRSQQQLNSKEKTQPAPANGNGDYSYKAKETDRINYDGRERRMNRAKEYLDQVMVAQSSRGKAGAHDNKSLMTHQDLIEMQEKIEGRSQSRMDNDIFSTPGGPPRSQRAQLLTRDNLRKLEAKPDHQRTPQDDQTYLSDQTVDVHRLLMDLNLPDNLF